jgi:hypothetical protein
MAKRIFNAIVLSLSVLVVLVLSTGCEGKKDAENTSTANAPTIQGGHSEIGPLSDNEREIFNLAVAGVDDVFYEPIRVSVQTVGMGFNYRFEATATPLTSDAEPYAVIVTIYKPFDDEPELIGITQK